MKTLQVATLMVLGTTLSLQASPKAHPKAGTTAAAFLKIPAGARAAGMGEAFGALADDASAGHWNPAGLAQLRQKEATVMHNESFADIRYSYLAFAAPLKGGRAWAVSGVGLDFPSDLERRSGVGETTPETPLTNPQGSFGGEDMSLAVSYAQAYLADWKGGLTLKYISQTIDGEKAGGYGLDLGALYRLPQAPAQLGITVQNFGPAIKFIEDSYNLPLNVKLGSLWRFHPKMDGTFDVNVPVDNYLRLQAGIEARLVNFFTLRAGYRYRLGGNELGAFSGLTVGSGFHFAGASLDYAFNPAGDLGENHRFSLTYRFAGAPTLAAAATAPAASQTTEKTVPIHVEEAGVVFRLVLKQKSGVQKSTAPIATEVLADATEATAFTRFFFKNNISEMDGLSFTLLESGGEPDAQAQGEKPVYKVASITHNFPQPMKNFGVAFQVEKEWLKANGLRPAQINLVRITELGRRPQPMRPTGENSQFFSFRADVDEEGPLAIMAAE